jgi:HAD superfamily hydrolase (TIGR01549 family)
VIAAVIFDIDGTLVDSVDLHARAWQQSFRHFGRDVPFQAIRQQIGKGGDQLLPVFFTQEEIERVGKELEEFRSDLFKKRYLPQVKPFPKVRDLFEWIKCDRKRIALASSAKGDELKTYKHVAQIADLLDGQTSADDVERSKPYPDIFKAALETLGNLDPRQAITVGDSPHDAQAAKKLDLRVIGVLCGGFAASELVKAGCSGIFRDPEDLLARYQEWAIE